MKITPGPWYRDKATGMGIHGANALYVAQVWHSDLYGDANAQAIAALPDCLEALQMAQATIERLAVKHGPFTSADGTLSVIQKALKKAGVV